MSRHQNLLIVILILISTCTSSAVTAQETAGLTVFRDEDSLTLYVPGNKNISLENLGFEVSINEKRYIFLVQDYEAFRSLHFSDVPTPICFRLERQGSSIPIPRVCQNITHLTQPLNDADVFWYDQSTKVMRTVLVVSAPATIGICAAGQAQCEMAFTPPQAATPTTIVPTPTSIPSPTITPPPAIGDTGENPVVKEVNGVPVVYVPEGCFMMGSEELGDDERPVHHVCLSAYWIGQTEVTNEQYKACVNAGVCSAPSNTTYFNNPSYADHPVVYVSWDDAVVYAEWIGGSLPTEAQWEYAARGPEGRKYPWGNEPPTCDRANISGCVGGTASVGVEERPDGISWIGALDMVGNVWEWVADIYDADYYKKTPGEITDPMGLATGEYVGLRGASWDNAETYFLPAASRIGDYRNSRYAVLGFRIVVTEP
jgi:formylglycine-generating enzyme required for sulfatase activity